MPSGVKHSVIFTQNMCMACHCVCLESKLTVRLWPGLKKKVGPNQTVVGSTLVVLKALNVIQLRNKRGKGGEVRRGDAVEKHRVWLLFLFFFKVSSVPAWTLGVRTIEPLSLLFPE